ncbi:acyl-CoA N-acyltransferase [Rhizodiscina lignyota]|uniref:Acyl-CoA N-acyltransferase n=1 Tax=Rhizodiscina lignyota TaxID=1504668 RepID=A0A9P4I643_9PEZI|nr:acyl-CoA N-acyltransferase [Rhizodiscina lignyota]
MPIRQARWTDLEAINALCTESFWDEDVTGRIMHPQRHKYPGDVIRYWRKKNRQDYWDWAHCYVVATDDEGKIVGFADWSRERRIFRPLANLFTTISLFFFPNRAIDPPALHYYERALMLNQHLWAGRRANPWFLDLLAVAPSAQRRGYGRQLVQWGLHHARKEKAPASVVSSFGNDEFYLKAGFDRVVGNVSEGEGNPLSGCKGGSVLFMDAPESVEESV